MNTTTAAQITGRSLTTIRRWCRAGILAAAKTGRVWVIDADSITAHTAQPEPVETVPAGPVELNLDVCTPEGKTWLAEIVGIGGQYGIERRFVRRIAETLSRSSRTGTETFIVEAGRVYESNEGRRRLGRRYWAVEDGRLVELDRSMALARVA